MSESRSISSQLMSVLSSESHKGKFDESDFPFIISTPVWGEEHLNLFLNVCLPSLLATGNLPSLAAHPQNRYLVYTCPEDEEKLKGEPTFRRQSKIFPVEVLQIGDETSQRHCTMSTAMLTVFAVLTKWGELQRDSR
jgi:hypothetical protein